jgi:hypothetical protein
MPCDRYGSAAKRSGPARQLGDVNGVGVVTPKGGLADLVQGTYAFRCLCLRNQKTAAGEAMPPSNFLTGPASSGRLVCAPGAMTVISQTVCKKECNHAQYTDPIVERIPERMRYGPKPLFTDGGRNSRQHSTNTLEGR